MSVPKLLNFVGNVTLLGRLSEDTNLTKLLSPQSVQVLLHPCGADEIARRQEMFSAVMAHHAQVSACLDMLRSYRHTLEVWRSATVLLERHHMYLRVLCEYADICGKLASFTDYGELFGSIAAYFGSEAVRAQTECIRADMEAVRSRLKPMHSGLISLSDRSWLTPADGVRDEFDEITECAEGMGFSVPIKKHHTARMDVTLSDALMNLYSTEISEIETLFGKYSGLELDTPCEYIGELSFVLEITELVNKAELAGIPHCFADIAARPCMRAKRLCDVSLLVKKSDDIIPNDADFSPGAPFKFLVGANGGGKTTYLRAIGINLVLFLAGCPVFAERARIYPFAFVASHFPADERFDGVGRLDEERRRCDEMLASASGTAFYLFNETYSGADEKHGFELLCETVGKIKAAGHYGLYVTHFHKVMESEYPVLSVQIDAADNNRRTFRVIDMRGETSSYAADILKKYGLDRASLEKRRCRDEIKSAVSDGEQ